MAACTRNGPTANQIQRELQPQLAKIREASIFIIPPPPVRGLGTAGGYKFGDFLRVGIPLTVIMWIGFSIVLPLLYEL